METTKYKLTKTETYVNDVGSMQFKKRGVTRKPCLYEENGYMYLGLIETVQPSHKRLRV